MFWKSIDFWSGDHSKAGDIFNKSNVTDDDNSRNLDDKFLQMKTPAAWSRKRKYYSFDNEAEEENNFTPFSL